MKPVDEAVWWIDYVLRNNDTTSLKPLGMTQYWFERRLLDVWAFVLFIVLVLVSSFTYLLKKFGSFIIFYCKTDNSNISSDKKQKVKKS